MRVTRSGLLKIAAVLGTLFLAKKGAEAVKDISESLKGGSTDQQNEADELLHRSHAENLVEGLVVKEVKGIDGKISDVKLWNKPSSHISQDPGDQLAGREIGAFKAGTIFSRGILVDGTDPRFGGLRSTHDIWVYVNESGDVKSGGFINISGLEYDPKFYGIKAIKLKSFNNP